MSKLYSISKYAKLLSFVVLIVVGYSSVNAKMARSNLAPMAPKEMISMEKVISYWQQIAQSEPQNTQAKSIYEWSTFMRDAMGLNEIHVVVGVGEKGIVEAYLVGAIEEIIKSKPWAPITDIKSKALVAKWRPKLEARFGKNSYSFAWVLFQLNEKESAKNSLQKLYIKEYEKVMKLKGIIVGLGNGSPLMQAQAIRTQIDPLSSDTEKKDMDEKMKKMKVHVSKLPESHVVT